MSSANPRRRYDDDSAYGARHQGQLAWTLFVALAVGAAAFYQAVSPKRATLSREAVESFRNGTNAFAPPADHYVTTSELGGIDARPAARVPAGQPQQQQQQAQAGRRGSAHN